MPICCKAAPLAVNQAAEGFINRLARVKGGDKSDSRNTKYVGEIMKSKIMNINQTTFDFGKAATRKQPPGLLEPVGQFVLGPAALVAELVHQSAS